MVSPTISKFFYIMRYGQNIKIVGGNDFDLLEPIYIRTYSNGTPIDTLVDARTIDDLVVKLNGVEFDDFEQAEDGIILHIPAEIEKNTYNIEYAGVYTDKAIRSAHFEAFTIVSWDEQADAIDYIEGSPIVLNGAYIIDANRGIIASQQETIRTQEMTIASQEDVVSSQNGTIASQQETIGDMAKLIGGVVMATSEEEAAALEDLNNMLDDLDE